MLGNCEQCVVQILRVYRLAQSCCSDCCIQPQFRVEGRSLCLSHKWSVSGWAGVGASVSYFTMHPWCQLNFTVKTCKVWPHPHFSHWLLSNSEQVLWPSPYPSSWCGSSCPVVSDNATLRWFSPAPEMIPSALWLIGRCPVVCWGHSLFSLPLRAYWGCLSLLVIRLQRLAPPKPCLLFQPPPRCFHRSFDFPFQARHPPFLYSLLNHISVMLWGMWCEMGPVVVPMVGGETYAGQPAWVHTLLREG